MGSVCYAICTNVLEKLKQISALVLTTIPLIFGALGSIPMTLIEINNNFYLNPTAISIVSLLVLSFICTSLGLLGWIYIMKRSSALIASTVIYLIPITAMIWSSLLLSEIITYLMVMGVSLMLFGVWITNYFDIKKNPGKIL
jgi:drug/metabolite transporter (DMT)-like permease